MNHNRLNSSWVKRNGRPKATPSDKIDKYKKVDAFKIVLKSLNVRRRLVGKLTGLKSEHGETSLVGTIELFQ